MLRSSSSHLLRAVRLAPPAGLPKFRTMATAPEASSTDIHTIELPEKTYATYNLEAPELNVKLTTEELLKMYKDMVTVRRLEMASDALYKAKKIRGFHLSIGQEAVAVGIEHAITKKDSVITSYRCHGFTYLRGATVKAVLAELLGRREGVSFGKGGSMHMYAHHFYGGNGIVGAQVPLGTGLAFAHKYLGQDAATVTLYGDGASNQGQIFESFNMAKLWNIPCIYACENNKYGMGTAASRASALTKFYERGQYIPGLKVNGMDVIAVYQATKYAKAWTSAGKGPIVLEFETYRYGGHSMSDPGTTYRTREEIQHMRSESDPIAGLKHRLINEGIITEEELKKIDKETRAFVEKEAAAAEASPPPAAEPKILFEDVYVPGTEVPVLRGRIPEENWSFQK
ncbi:uncharacterized protein SAPINGB_P006334 [Magnusiomyces paraingens]|uniref:Pyruvate dehydrogenase E1 component subunit alpha n=1 Tax=Magnusiomyces paraingens TaxID=2606893 RepID=A0A5E8C9J8_9ASCO|nr:uncharacterized protein SAPINGB_P006334 [Saprochaete ingens]VVT58688.1 unnamed protein product [Saprochaete ingens]